MQPLALLCAGPERPRRRRAAEQRNELSSLMKKTIGHGTTPWAAFRAFPTETIAHPDEGRLLRRGISIRSMVYVGSGPKTGSVRLSDRCLLRREHRTSTYTAAISFCSVAPEYLGHMRYAELVRAATSLVA
jgi:hypothetical protein